MSRLGLVLAASCCLVCGLPVHPAASGAADRIHLSLDTSEVDQVLAILALRQAGQPVGEAQWERLFATPPYRRLKERERKIGEMFHDTTRTFTDADFRKFVLSDGLLTRTPRLRVTLERWKQADLRRSAERVLGYLPDSAVIRAKIYPIIKPQENSFVWELTTDPTIFLYLDPEVSRDKFENTVAHEMHHIGLGSLGPVYDRTIAALQEPAHTAAEWMGGFGEGLAMLAAAGGPDVDPHAASTAKEHAQWEGELGGFDTDLPAVNAFFLAVLTGKTDKDSLEAKGASFFGAHQGPWYTVGYRMAVIVEKRYGRAALIRTMLDYRCLLALYNRAAAEQNARGTRPLPLWSDGVLDGVRATTCGAASVRPR